MKTGLDLRGTIVLERTRIADFIALTKPELTFLSVVTALAGFYLGSPGSLSFVTLLHTLVGTALVGGGAGALNQYFEREHDALMKRTESRPLPAGRLRPHEALAFGIPISVLGVIELTVFANALTGLLALVTAAMYLFLYTPMKRISPAATLIGAVPGAIPPMMGWTAARNEITMEAWILFGILFLWQIPHFLSLAWMYRKDYERAGYRLLTSSDPDGAITARNIVVYSIFLIPASTLPGLIGVSGMVYLVAALVMGAGFLGCGIAFRLARTNASARRTFYSSLLYLPLLFVVMVVDKV
jgi:protoheme IX farnesyltransferase